MFKRLSSIIFFVALIAVFTLSLASFAQDSIDRSELIPELINEFNLWRISEGLEPVVYNETLEAMAVSQADYVVSLPSIPDSFHTGRQGEGARQRSQFPEFQWANYGNPARFALSEIAALGSVRSAMGFWTTSSLHTGSALNPTYREVGIAARQLGSDVLFIVVLGGQPDVLPALADTESGTLYLTTERNEWSNDADWMGLATQYRILDADETPITDWTEWQAQVALPQLGGNFFVQYEDANGKQVTSEVSLVPRWFTGNEPIVPTATQPDIVDGEDDNSAQTGFFATNTPVGVAVASTEIPTEVPTMIPPTMIPPTPTSIVRYAVQLLYSDAYFTLLNISSEPTNLFDLSFRNGETVYNAARWEAPMQDLDISIFPVNHCLQIGGTNNSTSVNPVDSCRWIRSFVTINEASFFWTEGEFEVINQGNVIGTCAASTGMCELELQN